MGVPTGQTYRRVEALCASGSLGSLDDAQLLERFARRQGVEREDAFAALVRRHGPMVLAACSRMLDGPHRDEVDDAFQAVFLVLARKAGSLRRPDGLRPWLYGVAVKAGKEARRRSIRRRAREGEALHDALPSADVDPDLFDLRAAIDEELERLPNRYREPILLCELEGASRRDAAERLGLAEGTLSSRLARGRVLLRDRLARRGLAVATLAAAVVPPSPAAALETLVDAATRLVLKPNLVEGPAAKLAEGVLVMLVAARWKAVAIATATAAALGVLASGYAAPRPGPDPPPPAQAAAPEPAPKPDELRLRGTVVDEAGRPIPGAEVLYLAYTLDEVRTTCGPDGAFAMTVPWDTLSRGIILTRADDGRLLGAVPRGLWKSRQELESPMQVVAKPGQEIATSVTEAGGEAVVGAMVEAVTPDGMPVGRAATGPGGVASLIIPFDASVSRITAMKRGVGFDYAEFGSFGFGSWPEPAPAADLPAAVALRMGPPNSARVRALDEHGEPIAGVEFRIPMLRVEGRWDPALSRTRDWIATTDRDGVTTFDWLPAGPSSRRYLLYPLDQRRYALRPSEIQADAKGVVDLHLARNAPIRGRVLFADGSPARGVRVEARGDGLEGPEGRTSERGSGRTFTSDDGTYEMAVPPDESYAVWIADDEWAAASRLDVDVRAGRPAEGVDFRLARGTLIRGVVTVGDGHRPAADVQVGIKEIGGPPPADRPRNPIRKMHRYLGTLTDAQGRYTFRVGPGTYEWGVPLQAEVRKIVVHDEPEKVLDCHMTRPMTGALEGRVVDAAGRPVAEAVVGIASLGQLLNSDAGRADAKGRFRAKRALERTLLVARSPDGRLAGLREIGPDDPRIVLTLTPAASISGTLVDGDGTPTRGRWIYALPRVVLDPKAPPSGVSISLSARTDDGGRFALGGLPVGVEYEVDPWYPDRVAETAAVFRAEKPGAKDLGTLRIGGPAPSPDAAPAAIR